MESQWSDLVERCRTQPRDVARRLVAALSPTEVDALVQRIQVEAAAAAEYYEMLAEGRRHARRVA